MKNKICICICLAVVLSFCFPSLDIYAAPSSDYRIKTVDSVSGLFPDNQNYELVQQGFCSFDGTDIDKIYTALEGLTPQYDSYALFLYGSTLLYFNYDPSIRLLFSCLNSVSNNTFNPSGYLQWPNRQSIYENYTDCCFYSCNISGDSFTWSTAASISEYFGIVESDSWGYYWQSFQGSLLDSSEDFYVYCVEDSAQYGGTSRGTIWRAIDNDENGSFTNFNAFNALYMNSDGDIVDPSGPEFESNENHMYLKSCDVGFCKPYSVSDLSSAGGGYLYVNYTYDNWINSHSSDYWVNIRTVVNVDGTQYSGINTRALDLNGVNVLTFKESTVPNNWIDEGLLFVEFPNTVVSTYKAGYVYSIPYATFSSTDSSGVSNRSRFLGNGRNRLFLTPSGGRGYDITSEPLGSALQNIFNVVSHQRFTITVTVWLQDTDNNRSGEFTKTFNLITGVGTTTDTGITDNDNPFEPDPSLPDIPDGSGDDSNSVAPIVNNFLINGTGTIDFDPGYRELKEDIDNDPNGNFSQYLDPMHNDDVGSWFMSFVDEMPVEMKNILIAGVGVGVLFGLYRFIRRG